MKHDSTVPASNIPRQHNIVCRRPMISISPVTNGPTSPSSSRFNEIAPEIVATSQPNASRSGTMITPGALRTPTAPIITTKLTPRAIQA
jgi:hypothetical protein